MRLARSIMYAVVLLGLAPAANARDPAPFEVSVAGYVRDAATDTPIEGASVVVGAVTIATGGDGLIPSTKIPLTNAIEEVDVAASAAGYAPWRFEGLTLRTGEPVELQVKLRRVGTVGPGEQLAPESAPASADSSMLPEYIDIGRTYSKTCVVPSVHSSIPVERMRFQDYLRNVLPNEWVVTWPAAALDAGAVAAKQYAWYTAFVLRKWRRQGYAFDLLDNPCDQHYKDNSAHQATDAAFQRTWSLALTRNEAIFPLYYRTRDAQCGAIADCMGQWGSYERAMAGENGTQILLHYYAPADINPGEDAPAPEEPVNDTPAPPPDHGVHLYLPLIMTSCDC
jgi:peptidoglycan hydrolase-like amidase